MKYKIRLTGKAFNVFLKLKLIAKANPNLTIGEMK
ncbi:hypothetical protein LCGC14_0431090 [marine sediment metagenome]|uniref:Uncharacterized protein n=1 Tax=marine sediment metagenome TaxID=412755 RepID=A0A0F9SU93_9ZZZZ